MTEATRQFLAGNLDGQAGQRRVSLEQGRRLWLAYCAPRRAGLLEVLAEFLPGVVLPKGSELTPEEKKTNEYWQDRFVQYMREIFERRSLHFDCSMLQKRVVGADGKLSWQDVKCEEEDDFAALWSGNWDPLSDLAKGDEALYLPVERRGDWRAPRDMIQALAASGCHAARVTMWSSHRSRLGNDGDETEPEAAARDGGGSKEPF